MATIKFGTPFYLPLEASRPDGSFDTAADMDMEGCLSSDEAVEALTEAIEDHRSRGGMVFLCTPILEVVPMPRVEVRPITAPIDQSRGEG